MNSKAKPFIKWVGGKGQLIEQLEAKLPADFDNWDDATYIEPFVGGGAMLFYMLQQHPNIKRAVINDINSDLVTCYRILSCLIMLTYVCVLTVDSCIAGYSSSILRFARYGSET